MKIFLNLYQRTKIKLSKSIQKIIISLLKDYSINEEKINLELSDIKNNQGKIIYKGNENLDLKPENIIKSNNINLKYNYYVSNENNKSKLIILIERPGNYKAIQITSKKINNIYII